MRLLPGSLICLKFSRNLVTMGVSTYRVYNASQCTFTRRMQHPISFLLMHHFMSLFLKLPYHKVLVQNYTTYPIHNLLMLFYTNLKPINCCICCIYCNGPKSLCTISQSLILSQTIFPAKTFAKKIRVRVCELSDELDDPLVKYMCEEKLRL